MKRIFSPLLVFILIGCTSKDIAGPFDCTSTSITVDVVAINNASACNTNDGSISVSAIGGKGPYQFSVNGGAFSDNTLFQNLGAGLYSIEAKDANGCSGFLNPSAQISIPNSTLNATATTVQDSNCINDNGSILISATGGTPPYTYKLGNGTFTEIPSFSNLASGSYTIMIRDSDGCSFSLNRQVARGDTGISWSNEIQDIIVTNCAVSGCHNGTQSPNLSNISGVQANKETVKSRTGNGTMPPAGRTDLTAEQIKKIACWVDDGAKNN
ncbi:cytochrome c [Chryseotalea sanaruensis]|uniref:Cytochrome c n=1 Tax=Chryseotalea sanaruensis TaxID=2482724 RepID=A0A401U949_9BACT|nr:SprB repeat-containing protein [Chryseotalea sanaruensis]GCC51407.1 cytochrome c [Chryseotalea sanaruensis]